jgi:hypothetical protein
LSQTRVVISSSISVWEHFGLFEKDRLLHFSSAEEYVITTKIAIALIGILVIYAAVVVSQAYAADGGGLMKLVAHGSQDLDPVPSKQIAAAVPPSDNR